jgi:hypothetical protein
VVQFDSKPKIFDGVILNGAVFSGGVKDLPLNWPVALAKLHHYRLGRGFVLVGWGQAE